MKHGKIAGLKIKNVVNNSDHIMLLNNDGNMAKHLGLVVIGPTIARK